MSASDANNPAGDFAQTTNNAAASPSDAGWMLTGSSYSKVMAYLDQHPLAYSHLAPLRKPTTTNAGSTAEEASQVSASAKQVILENQFGNLKMIADLDHSSRGMAENNKNKKRPATGNPDGVLPHKNLKLSAHTRTTRAAGNLHSNSDRLDAVQHTVGQVFRGRSAAQNEENLPFFYAPRVYLPSHSVVVL